ncbi:MAG: acyl carrier protein [Dehalococcoidia bacterium]
MTTAEITAAVVTGLRQVAPDADLASLASDAPLRETLGIDSFDFLTFIVGLHKTVGVQVPEADYGQLSTLDRLVSYLAARVAPPAG